MNTVGATEEDAVDHLMTLSSRCLTTKTEKKVPFAGFKPRLITAGVEIGDPMSAEQRLRDKGLQLRVVLRRLAERYRNSEYPTTYTAP